MFNGKNYSKKKLKDSDYDFIEDPRYKQCNKEAMIGIGLGVLNMIWWFSWGYGLGLKPTDSYVYILGFPAWFFMSCIVGSVLFTILAIIAVIRYFEDMPLGSLTTEELEAIKEDMK